MLNEDNRLELGQLGHNYHVGRRRRLAHRAQSLKQMRAISCRDSQGTTNHDDTVAARSYHKESAILPKEDLSGKEQQAQHKIRPRLHFMLRLRIRQKGCARAVDHRTRVFLPNINNQHVNSLERSRGHLSFSHQNFRKCHNMCWSNAFSMVDKQGGRK